MTHWYISLVKLHTIDIFDKFKKGPIQTAHMYIPSYRKRFPVTQIQIYVILYDMRVGFQLPWLLIRVWHCHISYEYLFTNSLFLVFTKSLFLVCMGFNIMYCFLYSYVLLTIFSNILLSFVTYIMIWWNRY